jgi:hypothetical protein
MILGSIRQRLAFVLAVALMGLSLSCSEADPVPPSSGTISLSVQASTAGTGRYENVSFSYSQLVVRPVDEFGNAVMGSLKIGLTNSTVAGNLATGAATVTSATALPAGRYRVELLIIGPPVLADTTNPLPAPTACIENLATVPAATGAQIGSVGYVDTDLTDPAWILDISPGSQQLALTVDAPAFVQLVESSFTCVEGGGTATLTAFDFGAYRNGLLPLLAFRK